RGLVGEDGTAILIGGLRRDLVLDITGDDGRVKAPDVCSAKGKIASDQGNLVLLDGRMDDGEGVGAGRALEVFELVDSDGDAGGGAKHGGVAVSSRLGENAGGKGEEQRGGEDDAVH